MVSQMHRREVLSGSNGWVCFANLTSSGLALGAITSECKYTQGERGQAGGGKREGDVCVRNTLEGVVGCGGGRGESVNTG